MFVAGDLAHRLEQRATPMPPRYIRCHDALEVAAGLRSDVSARICDSLSAGTQTVTLASARTAGLGGGPCPQGTKRDRQLAGLVEANLDNAWCGFPPGVVNLSYQVYPWARERGYATRAVELVCRLLPSFDDVAIAAIRVQGGNIASRRVAEKAGFGDCGWTITPDGDRLRLFQRELPSPEDPTAATAQGRP